MRTTAICDRCGKLVSNYVIVEEEEIVCTTCDTIEWEKYLEKIKVKE